MVQSILSRSLAESSLERVDAYLPELRRLMQSIDLSATSGVKEGGSDVFKLDKDLSFEWRGHMTGEIAFFTSTSLQFELLMVLHCKAALHHMKAVSLLTLDSIGMLPEAGKNLVLAASIMDFICAKIADGTFNIRFHPKLANPPEAHDPICSSLFHYYRGSAQVRLLSHRDPLPHLTSSPQALSVVKAMTTTSTPSALKGRLALAVANSCKASLEKIASLSATSGPNFLFLVHLGGQRELFSAIMYSAMAESNLEKKEMGAAMAYANAAKIHLATQKNSVYQPSTPGLPSSKLLLSGAAYLSESVEAVYSTADKENRFIYFQPTPVLSQLPTISEASVMNPTPFTFAESLESPIVFVPQQNKTLLQSMISGFFSSTSSSSTSQPQSQPQPASFAPSAPAEISSGNDEELARELQRRYDAEASAGSDRGGGNSGGMF